MSSFSPKYLFLSIFSLLFSVFCPLFSVHATDQRDLPGVDIVTRAERGADDSQLLETATGYKPILDAQKKNETYMAKLKTEDFDKRQELKTKAYENAKKDGTINQYLGLFWSGDYLSDKVITKLGGINLRRPFQYRYDKLAIIVHHTADEAPVANATDEIDQMQKIYHFHTFTRGRGDIGYNFIIGPSGKVYEGRAGGPGVVGAHAKYNNNVTVGISLMGNFEKQKLPPAQRAALVALATALARKYNINPLEKTTYHRASSVFPYVEDVTNFRLIGHGDAGITACPGYDVARQLTAIRNEIAKNLRFNTPTNNQAPSPTVFDSLAADKRALFAQRIKRYYIDAVGFTSATNLTGKMTKASSLTDIKKITGLPVRVLLYDLSTKQKERKVSCSGCFLCADDTRNKKQETGGENIGWSLEDGECLGDGSILSGTIRIKKIGQMLVLYSGTTIVPIQSLRITPLDGQLVTVPSYKRKSYAGIPRNTFHGSLLFTVDSIPTLKSIQKPGIAVINELSLSDYLAGIIETNDTEPFEKNKVLALLAKNYILFYLDKTNTHPNIAPDSQYNAIDDPRFFQKYVGAGAEQTIKSWKLALKATDRSVLTHSGRLIITPYFSCSAGFTRSALEKRGWTDTPYLTSKLDIGVCPNGNFDGHGVGISGKGASILASKGLSYLDIIRYYYPGVDVVDF